jgi:hypothetical protein
MVTVSFRRDIYVPIGYQDLDPTAVLELSLDLADEGIEP